MGIYENPPKVFVEEKGRPSGIFVEIIEHVAQEERWKLEYVIGNWADCLDRLERGEIDLMVDVAYTPERAKIYKFHKVPVISSWFQVYAKKESGIRSILDLNKKRVAVLERSVQKDALERLAKGFEIQLSLVSMQDFTHVFEAVKKGMADCAVTNRFHGVRYAKSFGLEETAIIFHPTELFFAASKRVEADVLDAIDRHLLQMKKDAQSVYYHSLKKYLSEEPRFQVPYWLKMCFLVLLVCATSSVFWIVVLKKEVKRKTEELRKTNEEMEKKIEERTEKLKLLAEKAKEADRIKSAFLATMSHELRTPLNSIIGFTGILLKGLAGPLNEEQKKQLTMVQSSARHLLELINDVLDISKIEAGELRLSISEFNIKESVEKVVRMFVPLLEKKGLELKMDIGNDVDSVVTDKRRLEQVLMNLMSNAVKFTEKGSIIVSCRKEVGSYVISVKDTGIGIEEGELEKIFQPFSQIDTGLSRKYEGTGLGLSISKKLLDLMGGKIYVESKPGKGSTFTIVIPQKIERTEVKHENETASNRR